MATLDNVVSQLRENNEVSLGVESALLKLVKLQEDQADNNNRLKAEEQRRESSNKGSLRSGILGGMVGGSVASGGLGAGLGGLGAGLAKFGIGSAVGMGALGVALPAFFGGLLLGEQGLERTVDWLGADYDFVALGNVVEGFSGLVGRMSEGALVTLAGLMAVTGFSRNPLTGALALAAMGAAIPAFFGGLLLGDSVFENAQNWLGADFDFAATGRVIEGFSSMIGNLTPAAGIALGALLTAGVVSTLSSKNPLSVAGSVAVMGAAIPALLGGLLIGEAALSGVEWLGVSLDFNALGTAFLGFSSIIGNLTDEAVIALGGLLTISGVAAMFGSGTRTAISTAAIMTGIGAGISGLMIGLGLGEVGLGWIQEFANAQTSGLSWAFIIFNNAVGALEGNAITAMGALLTAGTALGATLGVATTPAGATAAAIGILAVMTGIGAGISGMMIGLGIGEVGLSWISSLQREGGSGLAWAMGAFNDAILAISDEAITKMATIANSGAGGGLKDLALGMVGFLTAEGMSEIGNVWGTIKDGVQGAVNWLFGTNFGENEESTIEKMVNSLEPLKDLDDNMILRMSRFGDAMTSFSRSFESLGNIETGQAGPKLAQMMTDIGSVMAMMETFIKGGVYDTGTGPALRLFGNTRGLINFGPGLENMDLSQLDAYADGINAIREALGIDLPEQPLVAPRDTSLPDTLQNLYVENLILRGNASQPSIIYAPQDNSSSVVGGGGGGARPAPPQVFDDRDRFFGAR